MRRVFPARLEIGSRPVSLRSDRLGLSPSGIGFGQAIASAKAPPRQAEVKNNDLATGVAEHGL